MANDCDNKNEFLKRIQASHTIMTRDAVSLAQAEELELSYTRLNESQAVSKTGSWDWNMVTDTHFHSAQLLEVLDLEPNSTVFRYEDFKEKMPEEDRLRLEEAMDFALRNRTVYDLVFRLKTKSGDYKYVHGNGQAQYNEAGQPIRFYGTARDVTREILLEQKFLQSQKMEAVGTFAAGIAHDFNNILHALKLLLEKSALTEEASEKDKLKSQFHSFIERGEDLIRKIITFARTDDLHLKPQKMAEEVTRVMDLMQTMIPPQVKLVTDIRPVPGFVFMAGSDIHQCVMNLFSNAVKAMNDAGTLTLRVYECDASEIAKKGLKPGRYAALSVTDTGCGIPQEILSRIFDPFFTTGDAVRGSGLGLAVVMGIVSRCKGEIRVTSAVGEGATIRLYFPILDSNASEGEDTPLAQSPQVTPVFLGASILLVEDDEFILGMQADMLESLGARVSAFCDGQLALAALKQNPKSVDILIADYKMPQMNGLELARLCRELNPELQVLFITGYGDSKLLQVTEKDGHALLAKPFGLAELSAAVGKILARKKPRP